ncbi:MAG: type II toxin-antitoxin system MqsR family toxin [Deltaproteobacteria bacterium]|nr:type II toxin-antitoxin system MqsR family toxin [Deltaproteobacteria bacterium]
MSIPRYNLGELKRLIENAKTRHITRSSVLDAGKIGYSDTEIINEVLSLKQNEFYKSMKAELKPGLWQDVYKPTRNGLKLYIKLQKSFDGKGVIISFKKAE